MLGLPGGSEIIVIGLIALLLFGNRLPSVMRSLGRSVTEFKRGVADDGEDDVDEGKKPVTHDEDAPA